MMEGHHLHLINIIFTTTKTLQIAHAILGLKTAVPLGPTSLVKTCY